MTAKNETKDQRKFINCSEGTVIMREGDCDNFMYKLLTGHCEVYTGYGTENETLICVIGKNSCFGEYGLLLGRPSIYTVVAFSDVCLLKIAEDEFDDFIMSNHKYIRDIMKNMANTMLTMRKQIELYADEVSKGKKTYTPEMKELLSRVARSYSMCFQPMEHSGSEESHMPNNKLSKII
jgi:CRP-like cAMP-binding protein